MKNEGFAECMAYRGSFQLRLPHLSSGTHCLLAGPFSDDNIAMGDLRTAMYTLGFIPKVQSAIFQLVIAVLLLGNPEFSKGVFLRRKRAAYRTVLFIAKHAAKEPDGFVQDSYAILYSLSLLKSPITNSQVSLSQLPLPKSSSSINPTWQSHNPTGYASGFGDEMLQSFYTRHTFNDNVLHSDGVSLTKISHLDDSLCIEMLKGIRTERKL
ncbi:hypothetical protein GYMLUDRAFT_265150 [Collybiopsis luxurians FD-317 M1]|uniref:Uncharacterized protein n=1 Tax=Collybiopsis luxurians FD-317 M1 TaxID=944289 RepID=A0A0D0CDW8_9AGAR|nr:hypothetical protein GYMLUDRAFT_265150 [Collybiopsis luxurians FD-317 M1]